MKYLLIFTFLLVSCNSNTNDIYFIKDHNMSSTIPIGSKITFEKVKNYKINDIVLLKIPNSNELTCLRIVGESGDIIEVKKGILLRNGIAFEMPKTSTNIYSLYSKDKNTFAALMNIDLKYYSDNYALSKMKYEDYKQIQAEKKVDSIYILGFDSLYVYPQIVKYSKLRFKNHFYFGPIKIPSIGDLITSEEKYILPSYHLDDGDQKKVEEKCFFCIGDSFSDAMDSRVFGLIMESDIIGKITRIEKAKEIFINQYN